VSGRINDLLKAEEMAQSLNIDKTARYAIDCRGDFEYDFAPPSEAESVESGDDKEKAPPTSLPFKLADLDIRIPKGELPHALSLKKASSPSRSAGVRSRPCWNGEECTPLWSSWRYAPEQGVNSVQRCCQLW
jgi:hypothetical protein